MESHGQKERVPLLEANVMRRIVVEKAFEIDSDTFLARVLRALEQAPIYVVKGELLEQCEVIGVVFKVLTRYNLERGRYFAGEDANWLTWLVRLFIYVYDQMKALGGGLLASREELESGEHTCAFLDAHFFYANETDFFK